ncbi:vanadium-dependent haloperoxidase [Stagnihabitans tardus]|uniref:Phosphatase PAP2 family protein n=1 Tax=Stagnihabitans tardus TaxID=2699202 RepID=A0AAE4Y717_9RHOB|nr:vanadium-dependent haloperoxidase [Stagnihabitans tardus]NBZ87057.1 phosphatase PAP2 family protein [Stagnihabitans tardus]
MQRRSFLTGGVALAVLSLTSTAWADTRDEAAKRVLNNWYKLGLELVRHTATMTPPVASRALALMGIGAYEALVPEGRGLVSLAGQLNGLQTLPDRAPGQGYDTAVVMNGVLETLVQALFQNTGPTGQHATQVMTAKMAEQAAEGVAADVVAASRSAGVGLGRAILDWAATDGGAVIENQGFPKEWKPKGTPGEWLPTSKISLQQAPLLPNWGNNRPFAMPASLPCGIADPTPYSEEPGSQFHTEALQVYETSKTLTEEQTHIARFWADDAMLTWTPPGHWVAILMQVAEERGLDLSATVEALARMGIGQADAFIACWAAKYRFDTIRPVTYIQKVIDKAWVPILNTPPFPEYPSGHSVQSAAGATVLTALFGEDYAFDDHSPTPDGVPERSFASFWAAADEAGISRLYGGIHFMPAITEGQKLGRCVGQFAVDLKTRA